jgi:hypothetical protein
MAIKRRHFAVVDGEIHDLACMYERPARLENRIACMF